MILSTRGCALSLVLVALPLAGEAQQARPAQPGRAAPATPAPAAAPATTAPAPTGTTPTSAAPAATPPAAEPAATPAPERSWAMNCAEAPAGEPLNCTVSTTVMLRPQNQRLAQVILTRQPETRSLSLVFQAPHGVLLPAGMSWQLDEGEAQRLVFQSSDAEGLYAGLPVADDLLASLRRGTTLRISFVVAARRETLTVPVPLAQFGEAAAEMFAAERARR